MRYKIELSPKAKKRLRLVPKIYKRAIAEAYKEISQDPFLGKELHDEYAGFFCYRLSVYRIIYKVIPKDKKVRIYSIGHRATVYINDHPVQLHYF